MRRSLVALAAGTTAIVILTGCGSKNQTYDAVCVNPMNNIRIDEDFCEEDDDDFDPNIPHAWLFFPGGKAPGMGQMAGGGLNTLPNNARANFISTDSDSKKHKPKSVPTTTVNVVKPTTQAPKPTTQAPKPSTQAPKDTQKPTVRVVPAPSRPFSSGGSTSGGRSGGSVRSGR
jgi:hypothetical protein